MGFEAEALRLKVAEQEGQAVDDVWRRRQPRKPDYNKLVPLVYAPLLPLCACNATELLQLQACAVLLALVCVLFKVASSSSCNCDHLAIKCAKWRRTMSSLRPAAAVRIGLKGRVSPGVRDLVFGGAVLTALAHAGYVRHVCEMRTLKCFASCLSTDQSSAAQVMSHDSTMGAGS